jgi:hypothetical protein
MPCCAKLAFLEIGKSISLEFRVTVCLATLTISWRVDGIYTFPSFFILSWPNQHQIHFLLSSLPLNSLGVWICDFLCGIWVGIGDLDLELACKPLSTWASSRFWFDLLLLDSCIPSGLGVSYLEAHNRLRESSKKVCIIHLFLVKSLCSIFCDRVTRGRCERNSRPLWSPQQWGCRHSFCGVAESWVKSMCCSVLFIILVCFIPIN